MPVPNWEGALLSGATNAATTTFGLVPRAGGGVTLAQHQGVRCGTGAPACGSRPFGSSPLDHLVSDFLDKPSPEPFLAGRSIADATLDPNTPEHAAWLIQGADGTLSQGHTMTSGTNWATIDLKHADLNKGENVVGAVHTHPGAVEVVQSEMDIQTVRGLAGRNRMFSQSFVVGPSRKGPYFEVLSFEPRPSPGKLITVGP